MLGHTRQVLGAFARGHAKANRASALPRGAELELGRAKESGQKDAPRDDAEQWMDSNNTSIASLNICNGKTTKIIRFNIYKADVLIGAGGTGEVNLK